MIDKVLNMLTNPLGTLMSSSPHGSSAVPTPQSNTTANNKNKFLITDNSGNLSSFDFSTSALPIISATEISGNNVTAGTTICIGSTCLTEAELKNIKALIATPGALQLGTWLIDARDGHLRYSRNGQMITTMHNETNPGLWSNGTWVTGPQSKVVQKGVPIKLRNQLDMNYYLYGLNGSVISAPNPTNGLDNWNIL